MKQERVPKGTRSCVLSLIPALTDWLWLVLKERHVWCPWSGFLLFLSYYKGHRA